MTPLKGIDVSSWQSGMDIDLVMRKNELSFAFVKATEGTYLVDSWCDRFVSELIRTNQLWGFYHFARNNDPVKEADYFYKQTYNYFGHGIPVLDIEDPKIPDWSAYAKGFADNDVFKNCALWVAGYPRTIAYWSANVLAEFDYSIYPWAQASAWQFSGSGNIKGYDGAVDLDYAWMDAEQWTKIATGGKSSTPPAKASIFLVACKVIAGLYGNGETRRNLLESEGYDYSQVQTLVNKMIEDYA